MSVEFIVTATILFGFTAYYFWFHNRKFPHIPTISRLCGAVCMLLSGWTAAAYLITPEIKSVTVHEVVQVTTPVGAVEVIKVDDRIINVESIVGPEVKPAKIKLTRYKETVLGIKIKRLPLIESIF